MGLIFTFCGILEPVTHTYAYPGWPFTGTTFSTLCGPAHAVVATKDNINTTTADFIIFDIFIV
jgi:hypothetical protein